MAYPTLARPAAIPPHVPPDCIVDVDLYRLPGSERDLHLPWQELRDAASRDIVWTPRNGGHWILTRGRDIARVYADHRNFSSRITLVPREWGEAFPLRPTTLDPPAHRPYRRAINSALSKRLVSAARPKIRQLAVAAIDRVRDRGHCEFIADVAGPLPMALFEYLAGVPAEAAAGLPRYGDELLREDGSVADTRVMDRFANYLRPLVAERQRSPGQDLLSELATATVAGRPLTLQEAVELATAVLTGGLDTVVSAAGFCMAFLARSAGHREQLVAEPTLIRPAVAELLRRFPIMTKARLVKHDQRIAGVVVRAGDMIVMPPLHGLDDREFTDPLTVDFARRPAANSTFGNGVHRCPGAGLATMELEMLLAAWLERIPSFELDPARPPLMRSGVLGAMLQLQLRWPTGAAGTAAPR